MPRTIETHGYKLKIQCFSFRSQSRKKTDQKPNIQTNSSDNKTKMYKVTYMAKGLWLLLGYKPESRGEESPRATGGFLETERCVGVRQVRMVGKQRWKEEAAS